MKKNKLNKISNIKKFDTIDLVVGQKNEIINSQSTNNFNVSDDFKSEDGFSVSFNRKNDDQLQANIKKDSQVYARDINVRFIDDWTINKFLDLSPKKQSKYLHVLPDNNSPKNSIVYVGKRLKGGFGDCFSDCITDCFDDLCKFFSWGIPSSLWATTVGLLFWANSSKRISEYDEQASMSVLAIIPSSVSCLVCTLPGMCCSKESDDCELCCCKYGFFCPCYYAERCVYNIISIEYDISDEEKLRRLIRKRYDEEIN